MRFLLSLLACTVLSTGEAASLTDLVLPDHRGGTCKLDTVRDRLLMYFRTGERTTAKRCDQVLSKRLGPERPLVRVIDGREHAREDRETLIRRIAETVGDEPITFLLDWDGLVAKRLSLPDSPLLCLGIAADGSINGIAPCAYDRESLGRILPLLPALDQSAFTIEELTPVKRPSRETRR